MILLALLIASIPYSAGDAGCPQPCSCEYSSVVCINKGLKKVPDLEQLTDEPMIIDLSGNRISTIDDNDFSFMQNNGVKEIYLNNSEVLDIDSAAFEELQNLQELYLGDNLLSDIPQDIIEDLPNMILLDLSNNYFLGKMPLIRSKCLRVLVVANSKINIVPEESLRYLPRLTILILQSNNIRTIDPNVFNYVTALSFSVKLSYNSWECSCENFELFETLERKSYISRSDSLTCVDNNDEMNIFDVGYVERIKSKCLKGSVLNDDSKLKQNVPRLNDSSYSLIKNVENLPSIYTDGGEVDATITNIVKKDVPVIRVDDSKEINTDNTTNCQESEKTVKEFRMKYHMELIVITAIFAMGLCLGCFLNQFLSLSKYTKLKQSDISLYT